MIQMPLPTLFLISSLSGLSHTIYAVKSVGHTQFDGGPPKRTYFSGAIVSVGQQKQGPPGPAYRGSSLIRKCIPLGPYSGPMPRVLGGVLGGGAMVAPGQQKQGPPGYCQPGWFVFESPVFLRITATAFESLVCLRFIAVTGLSSSHWFFFESLPLPLSHWFVLDSLPSLVCL
jgi:hypothetical protein